MASPAEDVPASLVRDVDLLCLDAGNTVIFLDHERLAGIVREVTGFVVSPADLIQAEGRAKALAETGGLRDATWKFRERPGAANWGKMVATIVSEGGLDPEKLPALLEATWPLHETKNLWCKVPTGLGVALDAVRARGVKTAIVSNSEGMLDRLFSDLGIRSHLDILVDSGIVGVEKPDPRIFEIALEAANVPRERALHLGDIFATDILGAQAAKIRCALIDPFGHYAGRHPGIPRVPGVLEVARAMLAQRSE
jgi:FMN phosphatase YigB (HAD superfamily)